MIMKKMMVMMGLVFSLSSYIIAGDSDKIIDALNAGKQLHDMPRLGHAGDTTAFHPLAHVVRGPGRDRFMAETTDRPTRSGTTTAGTWA